MALLGAGVPPLSNGKKKRELGEKKDAESCHVCTWTRADFSSPGTSHAKLPHCPIDWRVNFPARLAPFVLVGFFEDGRFWERERVVVVLSVVGIE